MTKPWRWVACLLFTMACLVAWTNPARCQEDLEQTINRVCGHIQPANKVRMLECRAVVIMGHRGGSEESLEKGLLLLKQAEALAPKDIFILNNIALCYMKQKNYKTALGYLDQVLEMKPSFVEVKFIKCLLEERLGYPAEKCKACYRSVAQHYEYRLKTSDVNYVYAELMLGGPNAERVKKNFLASLKPGSDEAEMWNELLRDFDREKFLHEMLP